MRYAHQEFPECCHWSAPTASRRLPEPPHRAHPISDLPAGNYCYLAALRASSSAGEPRHHHSEFIGRVDDGPGEEAAPLLLNVDQLGEFTPRDLVCPVAHDQLVRLAAAVQQVTSVQSAPPSPLLRVSTGSAGARSWKRPDRSNLLCHATQYPLTRRTSRPRSLRNQSALGSPTRTVNSVHVRSTSPRKR